MFDHLRLPEDTNVVELPPVRRIAAALQLAATYGQSVVVHGPHGTGKYTSVKMALSRTAFDVVDVDLEPAMSSKMVVRRLHTALVGHDDVSERDLQDDVVEALTDAPRVVVIRHADRLTREAAAQLNWLHQNPRCRFPMVLVGGPGMGRTLRAEAHMTASVIQTVEVTPLTGEALIVAVQQMHDLFAGAGVQLLTAIDQAVCHGIIRNWAMFLTVATFIRDTAVAAGKPAPVLGSELARATIHQMPATITKLKTA